MEPNVQSTSGKGVPPEMCIFVKEYTNRWGQVLRAKDYGKKAFVFFPKEPKRGKKN